MDFFIFLSSSSGVIGNRGQAHYAAGNSFQDALARYRSAQGWHSVSLDLGLVLGAGMVAQDERLLNMMRAAGFFGVRLIDFHYLLERAMANPGAEEIYVPAQIVTAVGTGGLTLQNKPSDPFWTRAALFGYLNMVDAPSGAAASALGSAASADLRSVLRSAADVDEAAALFLPAFLAVLAKRKAMLVSDFDAHRSFDAYGIDSMDSISLLGWVTREVGVTVQTLEGLSIWERCVSIAKQAREAED